MFGHPGIVHIMSTFFTGCNIRGKPPPGLNFIEKFDTIQPSFIAFAMTAVGSLNSAQPDPSNHVEHTDPLCS